MRDYNEAALALLTSYENRDRLLPEKPRPLTAGWESISWQHCPLAQVYGVPGQTTRESRTRFKRGSRK